MSEPLKVLPMAKLLRLAREKEERERAEREALASQESAENAKDVKDGNTNQNQPHQSHQTIVSQTIVDNTMPQPTMVNQTIVQEGIDTETSRENPSNFAVANSRKAKINIKGTGADSKANTPQQTIAQQTIVNKTIVDTAKGYYPVFNDISDRLIPELGLDPYQQAVLQRLYRLSRGWKSEECEVGLGTLARYCVMSRSQVQRSVAKLIEKGLLESLGSSKKGGKEGNRYKVLPSLGTIPRQTIPKETIARETTAVDTIVQPEDSGIRENTVVSQGIVSRGTNKNSYKELKNNTHTEQSVGVSSKFTLEECRRYAEHLQKTGQGINNPGGYATAIFRSGEFDVQIEAFLKASGTNVEANSCPDCGGTGYYYPEGVEKGVKICKHDKLKAK